MQMKGNSLRFQFQVLELFSINSQIWQSFHMLHNPWFIVLVRKLKRIKQDLKKKGCQHKKLTLKESKNTPSSAPLIKFYHQNS